MVDTHRMPPPSSSSCDDSLWPLLIIRLEGPLSPRQFEEMLETRERFLLRGERHLTLVDRLRGTVPTAPQRQLQDAWMARHETLLRERQLGIAYAFDTRFLRWMLNLSFRLKPPPFPYYTAPHLEQAAAWAARRFQEEGMGEAAERVRRRFALSPERGAASP
jgi:hypothetical protein